MVMKMNEATVTEIIPNNQVVAQNNNASTITITLHPQPPNNLDIVCDNNSAVTGETTITNMSPISDSDSIHRTQMLVKKSLKLDLKNSTDDNVETFNSNSPTNDDDMSLKSPTSPRTARSVQHQSSLTSQVEPVDDRKALRDALYQGIFHRHRRTIFAVGSFLRMLKSRSSQYNTIRSSSEGEEEAR